MAGELLWYTIGLAIHQMTILLKQYEYNNIFLSFFQQ
jgi:hypothetical protein